MKEQSRPLSQEEKVLRLLRKRTMRGATNFELSQLALKYTSVISSLRKDGYSIVAVRGTLRNGRPSNTWRYFLHEENRV